MSDYSRERHFLNWKKICSNRKSSGCKPMIQSMSSTRHHHHRQQFIITTCNLFALLYHQWKIEENREQSQVVLDLCSLVCWMYLYTFTLYSTFFRFLLSLLLAVFVTSFAELHRTQLVTMSFIDNLKQISTFAV